MLAPRELRSFDAARLPKNARGATLFRPPLRNFPKSGLEFHPVPPKLYLATGVAHVGSAIGHRQDLIDLSSTKLKLLRPIFDGGTTIKTAVNYYVLNKNSEKITYQVSLLPSAPPDQPSASPATSKPLPTS